MMARLGEETGLELVATNDSHYLSKDDAFAHEVLLCIGTGKTLGDEKRMKFYSDDFYVKNADEMQRIFRTYPQAIGNTLKIAERVNMSLDVKGHHLPKFPVPKGHDIASYFEEIAREGLKRRMAVFAPLFAAKRKKHEPQEYSGPARARDRDHQEDGISRATSSWSGTSSSTRRTAASRSARAAARRPDRWWPTRSESPTSTRSSTTSCSSASSIPSASPCPTSTSTSA